MKNDNSVIIKCSLCEEQSLHVVGESEKIYQCIWCGYMSSNNYIGAIEDNEHFKKLDDNMKKWAKESDGKIWIPIILTLPTGLIFPEEDDGNLKWSLAYLIHIPEEEQLNYPVEGLDGEFYKTMYDIENKITFDEFYLALSKLTGKDAQVN